MLARSEETRGSAVDEGKTRIDFRNGSVLMSRPASPKAIRGLGRDLRLLVLDEASLIDESIWTSAMFVAMDEKREGARIILADVPWGSREHWWRRQFELGTDKRHPDVEATSGRSERTQ